MSQDSKNKRSKPASGRRITRRGQPRTSTKSWFPDLAGYPDGKPVPLDNEYHLSEAYRLLKPGKSRSGLWIPRWICTVTSDPSARRLLALVLFYFDDKWSRSAAVGRNRLKQSDPEKQLTDSYQEKDGFKRRTSGRAYAMRSIRLNVGPDGDQVLQAFTVRTMDKPLAKLFAAASLTEKVGRRVLKELVDAGVLSRDNEGSTNGTLIWPNGHTLACKYLEYLGKPESEWPKPEAWLQLGWYESDYRRRAMNRDGRIKCDPDKLEYDHKGHGSVKRYRPDVMPGTFVDDRILVACEMKAGPAEIMSDLLWWHGGRVAPGNKDTLRPRAKITHGGYRWVARSSSQIEQKHGYPGSTIQGWLDWLCDKKRFFQSL